MTYEQITAEVTEGLVFNQATGNYELVQEVNWTSDMGFEQNGKTFIDGDEVAEEIQRRAAELGIED
jgi:hypothetical protein